MGKKVDPFPRTQDPREMQRWFNSVYEALNIEAVDDAIVDLTDVVTQFNLLLANMRKAGLLRE